MRTTKDWYLIAHPFHYQVLKLRSMHHYYNALRSLHASPEIKDWVQEVCLDDSRDVIKTVDPQGIDALLKQLPNIRTLEFRAVEDAFPFRDFLERCGSLKVTFIRVLRFSNCKLVIDKQFATVIQEFKQLASLQFFDTCSDPHWSSADNPDSDHLMDRLY